MPSQTASNHGYTFPNMDPRQNDKMLIDKYASPMAPPALVLLEPLSAENTAGSRLSPAVHGSAQSPAFRNSLLLDANDELGLQFLVSAAAFDSAEYTVLSLEEVERLKREHVLLTSRIDSSTRKLALESKVRDASQNLVKLHQARNKRLSKQAEEQVQVATRKVEDLATELWRLQRREATIRQQLMEHTAGVLSRSVRQAEQLRQLATYQDFDEAHLYVDAALSIYSGHDGSHESTMKEEPVELQDKVETEVVMRAEARLRETHRQLRSFLEDKASQQDEDDEEADEVGGAHKLEQRLVKLDESLLTFQEQHLQQKEDHLLLKEQQEKLLKELWDALEGDPLAEATPAILVSQVKALKQGFHASTAEVEKAMTEKDESDERHAAAMKDLQALYEKEMDVLHNKLDDLTEQHDLKVREAQTQSVRMRDLALTIQQRESDLGQAHSRLDELVQREATLQNAASTDRSLAKQHELTLAEMLQKTSQTRTADAQALQQQRQRAEELEKLVNKHKTELQIHRDRLDLKDQEVVLLQESHSKALQELDADLVLMRGKHDTLFGELQTVKRDREVHAKTAAEVQQQMGLAAKSLQEAESKVVALEAQIKTFEKQEATLKDLESEVLQLTQANAVLKAELDALQGSKQEREVAQAQASTDALVQQLEQDKASLQEQLQQLTQTHATVTEKLDHAQRTIEAAPTTQHSGEADRSSMLEARCQLLQTELDAMLMEYEAMTRSALFYESQRTKSENKSDALLEKVVALEAQVADLQVVTLGLAPKDGAGSSGDLPAEMPTTAQLRKEFRKLVQELRADHAKREKQDYLEIKRLEQLLLDKAGRHPMGSPRVAQSP